MNIDELLEFLARRSPGTLTKMLPVSPTTLEKLQMLVEPPGRFPQLYEDFLGRMGGSAAGFQLIRGQFDGESVWRRRTIAVPCYPSSRYVLFGVDEPDAGSTPYDWFLDLRHAAASADAAVVRFEDAGEPESFSEKCPLPVYSSFSDMLRDRAFRQYVLEPMEEQSRFRIMVVPADERATLQAAVSLFERLGLVPVLGASPTLWTGETSDQRVAAAVREFPNVGACFILLGSKDRRRLARLRTMIREYLRVTEDTEG